ncbi:MAG: D-glycero-beta-D-manno-heptose-7-phosphate kinase, partial [Deltaproteobacteria bacterium]
FLDLVEQFGKKELLVIGDLMLDRFIWGDVERISPEAPVPVLRVTSESFRLGGAANVIHNIRSLGGRVTACGIVGDDVAGRRIVQELRRAGASTAGVVLDHGYQTIQKTRVIASPRHQQIVRLDRENHEPIAERCLKRLREFILGRINRYDGVVISDYGKGVVHEGLLTAWAKVARKTRVISVIDPKKENYSRYSFPTLVTPNKDEASQASGVAIRDDVSLIVAGRKLVKMWQAKAVLITRGPEGMSLFRSGGSITHFPTEAKEIFDVTGAGDTVVAVCALALACGARMEDAAVMANMAAGLVGDEVGTVAVPVEKLKNTIRNKL